MECLALAQEQERLRKDFPTIIAKKQNKIASFSDKGKRADVDALRKLFRDLH
jgi:hypothetical protein